MLLITLGADWEHKIDTAVRAVDGVLAGSRGTGGGRWCWPARVVDARRGLRRSCEPHVAFDAVTQGEVVPAREG
jgi:hypothetical protein